ncbi:MAG TPA: LON peptidase substrate-binding domain-containing protein [Bacilli bacterium]|nr:LON peptidase substrate-binding domain-containing protein [Bacilli bacterium]
MERTHLQLFPLQTVLYPYGVMPLHIFEPRYRTMIRMCLEHDVPFGVVQIAQGLEVGGRPTTLEVGTVAKIAKAVEHPDGRLFITTHGGERFRIVKSAYDGECLAAEVEPYPDEPGDVSVYEGLAAEIARLFSRYWQLLAITMNKDLGRVELPVDDPDAVSWLVAGALNVMPELKQVLLTKRNCGERLELLRELLIEEMEKLRELIREARGE